MIEHKDISVGEIHSPFQWEVLNVAELSTIVPEGVNDVRKVAFVVDDGTGNPTAYVLTQFTPAIEWKPLVNVVGGGGSVIWGGIGGTVANQTDLVAYLQANFYTQAQINSFMNLKSDTTHNHTGVYEPADATIVKYADIGVTVQAYNANIQSHISSTSNPHSVTAAQVGAYTTAQTDTLLNGKIDESREGIANGIATLNTNAKINLSQIPDSILGQLEYQGVWDMTTLPTPTQKGHYWIASVAGNGYEVGDWAVYNGSTFDKVDNTDAVSSVAGRTGNIVLNKNDVGLGNVDNTSDLDKPISIATQIALDDKSATTHTHTIANVTGLQAALDSKAPTVHEHDSRYYTKSQADAVFSRPTGFKNYIINGGFDVWQRGTSQIAQGYGSADRWLFTNISGAGVTRSTDVPVGLGFRYSAQITTGADCNIIQIIESGRAKLDGKIFTVSFWVKANVAQTGLLFTIQTPTFAILSQNSFDITTAWTRVSIPIAQPTGGGIHENVHFRIDPSDTSGSVINITGVQLEEGSVATNFENRPYGLELALCQRYYKTVGVGSIGTGQTQTAVSISFPVNYEQMRTAPSVLFTKTSVSAALYELNVNGVWITASGLNVLNNYLEKNGGNIVIQGFSGLTAGQTAMFNNIQQILALSAEL